MNWSKAALLYTTNVLQLAHSSLLVHSEVHSEPNQTFKKESFVNVLSGSQPLSFFAEMLILDVWLGSEYPSNTCIYWPVKSLCSWFLDSFLFLSKTFNFTIEEVYNDYFPVSFLIFFIACIFENISTPLILSLWTLRWFTGCTSCFPSEGYFLIPRESFLTFLENSIS